jgi:uncharacterized membrane protein YidH (DUF202 family)
VQPLVPTIPAPPLRGRRFWIGVVLALVATFVAAFAAAAFFQRRRQKRKRRSDARDEAEP